MTWTKDDVDAMDWAELESSHVLAAAWDETGLYLKFKNGSVYLYANAPIEVVEELLGVSERGESVGRWVDLYVKNGFNTVKLYDPRVA